MKRTIASVIAILLLGVPAGRALADDTLDDVRKKGIMVAGVKGASPPFGFLDRDTGAFAGYEIDLVRAVAARLGVRAIFTPVTGANRVPELLQGNVDLVAATMTKTPDREKAVDFSDTYYLTSQKVLARKGAVKSLADLEGRKVGTAKGSAWAVNLGANVPGATVVPFDNGAEALEALRGGRIDAVSTDEVILATALRKLPQGEYEIPQIRISEEPYAFAVRKGDRVFLEAVNAALRDMVKGGEARALFARWFGAPPASAPAELAGGIVVRRTADLTRFVVMPVKGVFKPGAVVSFYDPSGNFVAAGKVKSFYTDEVYVDAVAGTADSIGYGFVVGMNVTDAGAKEFIRKNRDLLASITDRIRQEESARREQIGRETATMEKIRRQEQAQFEMMKMQLDYAYDRSYGWYGYPW